MKLLIAILLIGLLVTVAVGTPRHRFTYDAKSFYLDDKPITLRSGEMHFCRIPHQYWRQRIRMAKAMGLNTIGTYVMWNFHETEKGKWNFKGDADLVQFIKICQEEGMWVALRPGPYVCAEWEWGGFPYWLATECDEVRGSDPKYLAACRTYLLELGKRLQDLQISRNGPILIVQVENEYGSFGKDLNYMSKIRDYLREAGFDVPLYTVDGPGEYFLKYLPEGGLPGTITCINFGGDPEGPMKESEKWVKNFPKTCGEFYPGWLTHWGENIARTGTDGLLGPMEKFMDKGFNFSMYMFHGGTNFGFWNGANFSAQYQPHITSYDYDAPLDEAGRATPKYTQMRDTIQKHIKEKLPPVPPAQVVRTVPSFSLVPVCNITSKLPRAQKMHDVTTFEKLGQGYGFVLYRTKVQQSGKLKLELKYQDRCTVLVNGVSQGSLFRGFKEESISVNVKLGDTLDILVENMGRVNYGPIRVERKGLLSNPVLDGKPLTDWEIFKLPFSTAPVPTPAKILNSPTLYTGSFAMDSVADTYLDVSTWGHGVVWVNGHNLGRYWNVGPTQTLYCPGVWLKKVNSVVVLEMDTVSEPKIQGLFNHKYELRRKFY